MLSHAALVRSRRGRSRSTGFRWVDSFAVVSLLALTIPPAGFARAIGGRFADTRDLSG